MRRSMIVAAVAAVVLSLGGMPAMAQQQQWGQQPQQQPPQQWGQQPQQQPPPGQYQQQPPPGQYPQQQGQYQQQPPPGQYPQQQPPPGQYPQQQYQQQPPPGQYPPQQGQFQGQAQFQGQVQYGPPGQPMMQQQPMDPARQEQLDAAAAGHFNVGRYFLEVLVGGLAGSLAAYGGYSMICDEGPCVGGMLLGLTFNVLATPVGVTLIGAAMGGMGNYWDALLGGLVAFAGAGAGASDEQAVLALSIGLFLSPFTSAFLYELFSSARAQQLEMSLGVVTAENGDIDGGALRVGGVF
jgi:hypothetical protein